MGKYVSTGTELYHYGVLGMKWGVRKSEYKSMNKQQRQETRNKYYNTPEGKIKRATSIGTMLAGQVGGVIAGSIMAKKVDKLQKNIVNNGKKNFEKHKTAKIETSNKTKKLLENTKTNRDETDEQKKKYKINDQLKRKALIGSFLFRKIYKAYYEKEVAVVSRGRMSHHLRWCHIRNKIEQLSERK